MDIRDHKQPLCGLVKDKEVPTYLSVCKINPKYGHKRPQAAAVWFSKG